MKEPRVLTASPIRKRSVETTERRTSVSLEEEFWEELKAAMATRGITMNELITEIDATRTHHNLSSALRIYALRWAKERR